jgi:hypothetical protein
MAQSIGTMLGTRIESGARHMLQIRVDKERFVQGISKRGEQIDIEEELRRNKHKYSMTKDEMVLCSSRNLLDSGVLNNRTHPYPKAITTWLGLWDTHVRKYVDLMGEPTAQDYYKKLRDMETDKECRDEAGGIPSLRCMGYSVGTAYASELNGDTIAAVQVGGLISVQNGAFPMHTGDLVQWYFHEREEPMFDAHGKRIVPGSHRNVGGPQGPDARQQFFLRNTGISKATKSKMFLPKPYDPETGSHGDRLRVFAKCLSAAAPYERVDIMICRQSF